MVSNTTQDFFPSPLLSVCQFLSLLWASSMQPKPCLLIPPKCMLQILHGEKVWHLHFLNWVKNLEKHDSNVSGVTTLVAQNVRSLKMQSSHRNYMMDREEENFLEGRRYIFQKKGQLCTSRKSNTFPLHCFALSSDRSKLPKFLYV